MSDHFNKKKQLQDKLEVVKLNFLRLLGEIPDKDLERKFASKNWTIKEELVHIVQVLEVIPLGMEQACKGGRRPLLGFVPTNLRSWVNGQWIIPRKAKHETRDTIAKAYLDAHEILVNQLNEVNENDWEKGMPYPRNFRTVEQMALRPIEHFEEHKAHICSMLTLEN